MKNNLLKFIKRPSFLLLSLALVMHFGDTRHSEAPFAPLSGAFLERLLNVDPCVFRVKAKDPNFLAFPLESKNIYKL